MPFPQTLVLVAVGSALAASPAPGPRVHALRARGHRQHRGVRAAYRPGRPLHAIVGGLHLFSLDDERLDWTADRLRAFGLENLLGAHCTGIEAVYRVRQRAGLARRTSVVGAVGASFDLQKGIDPKDLAR